MAKKSKAARKKPAESRRKRSLNIKVSPETHKKLEDLKIIPQEPFESVIKRLIDFYEKQGALQKEPQTSRKEGFIA